LALCLGQLAPGAQTLLFDQYEVIVSDDGRTTNAEFLVRERFPWARWVEGPRRGPAANRNNGARVATGEWLVFTDDDCLPDAGWLKAYAENTGKASVLEGLTKADRPKQRLDEEAPINLTGGYLWSCNFAIEKALFFRVDGFDENFQAPAMEDCDLRERIKELGQPILFCRDAEVIHPWRRKRNGKFHSGHRTAYLYFLKKHPRLDKGNPGIRHIGMTLRVFSITIIRESGKLMFHGLFGYLWYTLLSSFEGIKMVFR